MTARKKTVAQRMDAARIKAELSVAELARLVGVSQPYMRRVLRGEALPVENARERVVEADAFVSAVAEATGVPVGDLG